MTRLQGAHSFFFSSHAHAGGRHAGAPRFAGRRERRCNYIKVVRIFISLRSFQGKKLTQPA